MIWAVAAVATLIIARAAYRAGEIRGLTRGIAASVSMYTAASRHRTYGDKP